MMNNTQQAQANELLETFALLDTWEDRYGYLIDLGRELAPLDAAHKTEENRVHGCQSNVWMVAEAHPTDTGVVIEFQAESDSAIVQGLIAILTKIYSGQPAEKILTFDIQHFLEQLGLSQHLSVNRRNGLYGMVRRIKLLAATLAPETAQALKYAGELDD